MSRLPSHIVVGGLLRAAEAAGGNGVVLERGDRDEGALLVVLTSRGEDPNMFERVSEMTGDFTWNRMQLRGESVNSQTVARLVAEKKRFDRDLWALELDIPDVEQFIADSLGQT